MDNIGSNAPSHTEYLACDCGLPWSPGHRCKDNPLGSSPMERLMQRVEHLEFYRGDTVRDMGSIEKRLEALENKVQKLQDTPKAKPGVTMPPNAERPKPNWTGRIGNGPGDIHFVDAPLGKSSSIQFPWECPRCGTIHAAWVNSCTCKTTKDSDMSDKIDSASDDRTANNAVRHQYRTLSDIEKQQMVDIKDLGASFLNLVDNIGSSRDLAIAKTKIEEAVMWAVKHVTR